MNCSRLSVRRILSASFVLGLVAGAFGVPGFAAPAKKNPLSKLYVADMQGSADIETEEKILELTKKSVHSARAR